MKCAHRFPLILLACAAALFSAENVVNYSSPIAVNFFLESGDTLWAATSGGLAAHNLKSGGNALISNAKIFPDPHITALCRDQRGNLWAGSQRGYLYRMTPRGQFSVYSNYKVSGWGILSLYSYGDLIVVGADRGVSLFDPHRGVAVKNAVSVGGFASPRVNVIAANGDTLFLGCDEGVAYLDSLNVVPLAARNFYYPGIWKTVPGDPAAAFVDSGGVVSPKTVPAVMFRGHAITVDSDSGWILGNGQRLVRVVSPPGKVLRLYNEGDRRLWIGTDDNYYYSYDGESVPKHYAIEWLSLRRGSRLAVSADGDVWVLPMVSYRTISWHHGIYRYDGRKWHIYNYDTHGSRFGYIGDDQAFGIALGRGGTLWAGTWGGNIKHIDPSKGAVAQLFVGSGDFTNIEYNTNGEPHTGNYGCKYSDCWKWGKVDALAVDSSGYLWASAYDHSSGSIICYDQRYLPNSGEADPVKARYRWFFDEAPYKTRNITELSADVNNRIFAYDAPQNRLTLFSHGGDPLAGGIKIDTSYAQFGTVTAIRSAPDGVTYIAGARGLMKVSPGELRVETVDSALTDISGMALQDGLLWIGTYTNGVLRYDLGSGGKRWIGEADGLLSNDVQSVAVDGKNGYLWVLTDYGVSRVDVGRRAAAVSKEPMRVFPNVFSIGRKVQGASSITFARLEPRSSVSVYAVNGALVAKVNAEFFTDGEWRAAWTPRRNLAPGMYIAVAKPSGKRAKIILKP